MKLSETQREYMKEKAYILHDSGMSFSKVAKELGCSKSHARTLYNEYMEEERIEAKKPNYIAGAVVAAIFALSTYLALKVF